MKKKSHPYIPFLLEDIKAAHRSSAVAKLNEPKTIEKKLEKSERFVSDEREHTLSYYCGLKPEDFPPVEQLSDRDMQKVCEAFNTMMDTWNLSVDLPENLPPSLAYQLTIGLLSKETFIPNCGTLHIDFCTGYAPDCELKQYCPCLKIWNEK